MAPRSPVGLVLRVVPVAGGPAAAGARRRVVELLLRASAVAPAVEGTTDQTPRHLAADAPPPADPGVKAA